MLELKNKCALQQIADIVDGVRGMGPFIKKQLFDKGLQIPTASVSAITTAIGSAVSSSKHSIRSTPSMNQESDFSMVIEKPKTCSNSLSSQSSAHSSASMSKKSTESIRRRRPAEIASFSIDGQSIGTTKSTNQKK